MTYYKFQFTVSPLEPFGALLQAQLGEMLFETFVDTPDGFEAYIAEKDWDESITSIALEGFPDVAVSYTKALVKDQNWNEEWEKNFNPITIGDCHIRATFHPSLPDFKYEIVINPKMSFGTGHHQTTTMMLQLIQELEVKEQDVLDMGAGTAVLAILAKMKGSAKTTAIDIDEWAYENAVENVALNGFEDIVVKQGGAECLGSEKYNHIFANINRNILLADIQNYVKVLHPGGRLLLSGFYREDIPLIQAECEKYGLAFETKKNIDNWVAVQFKY